MNRTDRRAALIRLHTAKLIHAKMLGCWIRDHWKQPTRVNVHCLQIIINEKVKK